MESETDVKKDGPVARRGFIERTLRHLAGDDLAESARGDLEEEAGAQSRRYGRAAARLWISLQGLHLILGLVDRNVLSPERWFGEVIMDSWTDRRRRLVALVGHGADDQSVEPPEAKRTRKRGKRSTTPRPARTTPSAGN